MTLSFPVAIIFSNTLGIFWSLLQINPATLSSRSWFSNLSLWNFCSMELWVRGHRLSMFLMRLSINSWINAYWSVGSLWSTSSIFKWLFLIILSNSIIAFCREDLPSFSLSHSRCQIYIYKCPDWMPNNNNERRYPWPDSDFRGNYFMLHH